MSDSKILVVDDDEEIRELVDTFLSGEGYTVFRHQAEKKQ